MNTKCTDCQIDTTWSGCGGINEWYMVWDYVWCSAKADYDYILCIGCLEKRLARKLTPEDFRPVPLNFPDFPKSTRLQDRLGHRFHDLTIEQIQEILK